MQIKLFLILLFFSSCASTHSDFLTNFSEKDKASNEELYRKEIDEKNLDILLATNESNDPIFNIYHRYYYGYRIKLDKIHYLVSYRDIYKANYRFTHLLNNWADTYLCIYNTKELKVVSKLKIYSSDPIFSKCEMDKDVYVITSYFKRFETNESDCIWFNKDTVVAKYKIINNRFKKVE